MIVPHDVSWRLDWAELVIRTHRETEANLAIERIEGDIGFRFGILDSMYFVDKDAGPCLRIEPRNVLNGHIERHKHWLIVIRTACASGFLRHITHLCLISPAQGP